MQMQPELDDELDILTMDDSVPQISSTGTPGTPLAMGRNKGKNCPMAVSLDIDTPLEIGGPKGRNWMVIIQNLEEVTHDQVDMYLKSIPSVKEYGGQPERGIETGHLHAQCYVVCHNNIRGSSFHHPNLKVWRRRADNIYAVKNYSVKKYTRSYEMPGWSSTRSILCANPTPRSFAHLQLTEWQEQILQLLRGPTDDRTVIWVWSEIGGTGKTCFAGYLTKMFLDAQLITATNGNDIRSMVDPSKNIYVIDIPRAVHHAEGVCTAIEYIKNGEWSRTKLLRDPKPVCKEFYAHVVVFTNYRWNSDELSDDRILEYHLTKQLRMKQLILINASLQGHATSCTPHQN